MTMASHSADAMRSPPAGCRAADCALPPTTPAVLGPIVPLVASSVIAMRRPAVSSSSSSLQRRSDGDQPSVAAGRTIGGPPAGPTFASCQMRLYLYRRHVASRRHVAPRRTSRVTPHIGTGGYDGHMPNIALPPLPRPRGRRARGSVAPDLQPEVAAPEIIEASGLRWIHIESPRTADRDWLEEQLRLPPARLRGRLLAQPAPEARPVRRLRLHRPALPAVREGDRADPDRGARPVHGPGLPDHAAEHPAAAADRDVRALSREGGPARGDVLEGLRLPALQDRRHLRRRLVPDAAQDGDEARPDRGRHLRGPLVARSSATSPRRSRRSSTSGAIVRPQRAVLRDLERTKQRYLQEELEIYFDDISDAAERIWDTLENYKEVIEALESTERIRAVAPPERLVPDPDRGERRPPAADADREHLRDERAVPGRERASSRSSGSSAHGDPVASRSSR